MQTAKHGRPRRKRKLITGEEYGRREYGPSELVRGKVVCLKSARFNHGEVEYRIARALGDFVESRGLGRIGVGEVGVYTERGPDTIRGADVVFISNERLARQTSGFLDVAPELVVEVHGGTKPRRRLDRKIAEYFACGVRVVWVAEPKRGRILVHRSPTDVREVRRGETLTCEDLLPGFAAGVAELLGS